MEEKRTNIRNKKPDGTRETIYFRIGNNSTWKSNYIHSYVLQVEPSKISFRTALIQFGGFCDVHTHTTYQTVQKLATILPSRCYYQLVTNLPFVLFALLMHPSFVQRSLIYVIALVSAKMKQRNTTRTHAYIAKINNVERTHTLRDVVRSTVFLADSKPNQSHKFYGK